jgi:TonB family protein
VIVSSLILVLGCCAIPLLRRRSGAERHVLWMATLATATLAPALRLVLPSWQPNWVRQVVASLPAPFEARALWTADPRVDIVVRANAVDASTWALADALVALWAIGVVVIVLALAVEGLKLARLASRAKPLFDESWHRLRDDVARALRLTRPIRLLQGMRGSAPLAPVTWGLWHPRVLLPADSVNWSEDRKRAVLLHELAHIRRGDWIVQVVSQLACALYWFHPLFWIAQSRLCRESEHACDDVVLNLGMDGEAYASHLLEIARAARVPQRAWTPTVAMARPSHLERRFAALLNPEENRRGVTRRSVVAVSGISALLLVPLAALGVPGVRTTVLLRTAALPTELLDKTEAAASAQGPVVPAVPRVRMVVAPDSPTGDKTSAPEILEYTTPPLYSDEARRRGIEGFVTVEATIDVFGAAHLLRVTNGLGFGLDQNALVALRQWRFRPGLQDGTPVEMTAEIDIEFRLRNEALNELIANDMATRVGPGVTPPRAVRTVAVLDPRGARSRIRQGTVVLDVVLQEDGTPRIVRILQSLDADLDDAAVRAFEQWRFSPATESGRPVKVRMNAEVTFHE